MRRILKIIALFCLSIFLSCSFALAEKGYQDGERITLYTGEMRVFAVDWPTRIIINAPEVADVTWVSEEDMFVVAKNPGITSLIWWDGLGQHALQLEVLPADMDIIKQRVENLIRELDLPDVFVRHAEREGKILLLGRVKSEQVLNRINAALGELSGKTTNLVRVEEEEASVEINIQILEISRDATRKLGFEMPTSTALTEPFPKFGDKLTDIPEALFNFAKWTRAGPFSAVLNFLIEEGKARILSQPRLVCQSGKEAELLVGGEKPIMTSQAVWGGGTSTEVDYKQYGIKLSIRPNILPQERIQISLDVDISDVGEAEVLGYPEAPTAKAWPLKRRTTSTELILGNAETLAISGLIRQVSEEKLRKFPGLGDIPVLGIFFRGRETKRGGGDKGDTELVITLTPVILKEATSAPRTAAKGLIDPQALYPEITRMAIDAYTQRLIKRIQDNFVYPPEAHKEKLEGLVNLSLYIRSDGEVRRVEVSRSSGWSLLDENAVRIINHVSPFPPFPPDIEEKELRIDIPINYALQ